MSAVVFQCRYLHQFELANVCFELAFICFALIFDKKLKLAHAGKRVQTMILMMRILFYLLFTFTSCLLLLYIRTSYPRSEGPITMIGRVAGTTS